MESAAADAVFHGAAGARSAGNFLSARALYFHGGCDFLHRADVAGACVPVSGAHDPHGGLRSSARVHAGDGAQYQQQPGSDQAPAGR